MGTASPQSWIWLSHIQVWLLGLTLALCRLTSAQDLPILPGKVTRVLDGDTADVQLSSGPIRVRFNGIDSPEKNQPIGLEATAFLTKMIDGKSVRLEPYRQDRYDRIIANVLLGNLNVNEEMVREGYAWAYRKYMKRENPKLCTLEDAARRERRGLWVRPSGEWIAPWEWRRLKTRRNPTNYSHETAAECVAAIGRR